MINNYYNFINKNGLEKNYSFKDLMNEFNIPYKSLFALCKKTILHTHGWTLKEIFDVKNPFLKKEKKKKNKKNKTKVKCSQCDNVILKENSLSVGFVICSEECEKRKQVKAKEKFFETIKNKTQCSICFVPLRKAESVFKSGYICSDACNDIRKSKKPKHPSVISIDYHVKNGMPIEEAKILVSELQKQRSPRNVEYWINKGFSLEDAKNKVSEHQKNISQLDTRTNEEKAKPLRRNLDYYIAQGLNETDAYSALEKFFDRTSKSAYIERYGEAAGTIKYEKQKERFKKNTSIEYFISKYGEENGMEMWRKKFDGRKYSSKSSSDFFLKLYDILPQEIKNLKIYFKSHPEKEFDREFGRRHKTETTDNYFFYDFVISELKFCIEYNGSIWHADPEIYKEKTIKYGDKFFDVEEIHQKEKIKIEALESDCFIVKILWMNDKKTRDRYWIKLQIDELVEEIKLKYEEYKK